MNLRTTAIVAGLAAALGTGAAYAQSYSQDYPPPSQQTASGHQHRHHHGVIALIKEEVNAGRISHKEGTMLEEKIRQMKSERRAERQARAEGGQGNYPPSSQQPAR